MDFNRILVPVAGTAADDETLRLAVYLARKNKAKVWVVYIIVLKRTLPVDAEVEPEIKQGEEILDHIEAISEELDYRVETDLLQSRDAGPTIVDEANERQVDLILMGVKYKRRLGQFSLGNVVPYVLKNASCRVILYQQ